MTEGLIEIRSVRCGGMSSFAQKPFTLSTAVATALPRNSYHSERFRNHGGRACYVARCYAEAADALARISWQDHTHQAFRRRLCAGG